MLLSIEGEEATGKTTIGYTAPLPIVGFSFDLGNERALYGSKYDDYFDKLNIKVVKYQEAAEKPEWADNDITIYELPMPIQLNVERIKGYMKLWDYFMNLLARVISDPKVQTIVVDTMTLARRIKADAYLEELQESGRARKQLLQIEWGHPNDAIRDIYSICKVSGKNLIVIHHLTDERKDAVDKDGAVVSMLTGDKVMEGYNKTYREVDSAIRMEKVKGQLSGRFIKCGHNLGLEGTAVPNPSWDRIVQTIEMSLGGRISFPKRAVDAN